MKRTVIAFVSALLVAGAALAERTVEESYPLAAGGRVEISNISGDVTVGGWSGDTVEIDARLEDGVEELAVSASGSRLSIEVELERRVRNNGSAWLTVRIPSTADLEVETVSANISVEDVAGEVSLEAVSGKVEVSGSPASLEATSVSGDVVAASTGGRSELETVSGDIIVRTARGRLETEVVSGDIEIGGGSLEGLTAESVSGSIYCAAQPTDNARFNLETMSGTIEMLVSPDNNADYYVETYSGAIKNQIGPPPRRTDEYGPGKELRFTTGSGGARVVVESFSGMVKLSTR